ncbi:L-2-hydroxyglutarate oxidase [Saccharopolyspora phatthalungensis]|uniref:Malate dehydrogenase (Quinone)/L-2-hydroxyglutarate oxidase n=1 Tax=Saccharopolyspora phatthalungensis TaxID=664693 RepID=A0A840QIL0_9PSEU|nr:L-2-hydroxyglutarate oxidase [Saccharopolyspora phatthalungensis]MBB5158455.1 malate dehydrogenase (quinone)/L-2-hydroxyglutarate oxidase [Saccharopolyspora phatthalungensis]
MSGEVDIAIIGGGLLGLATARAVLRAHPGASVAVLEKESRWGAHQSGHNSNVIHSGLYYAPGSLKARLARAGGEAMIRYCEQHGVPVKRTGKIVVATAEQQLPRLDALAARGRENGVTVARLSRAEIAEREPHVAGVGALAVADTAMTDFGRVCLALATELTDLGADLRTNSPARSFTTSRDRTVIDTPDGEVRARIIVNCAGLHSDKIAEAAGHRPPVRIMPFRGEYAEVRPARRGLITNPVYPVPDPELPFLGVHVTPMLDGSVHVGPNAVPALARQGYRWRDVDVRMLGELLRDPAVRGLARRYWRYGIVEISRSLIWPLFVRDVRRLIPEINGEDLRRDGSGVRAQAVTSTGELVDDFVISRTQRAIHVLNAPSPAATSSLFIGSHIAADAFDRLGLADIARTVRESATGS